MKNSQGKVRVMNTGAVRKSLNSGPLLAGAQQVAEMAAVLKSAQTGETAGSAKLVEQWGENIDGQSVAKHPFDMAMFAFATTVNTWNARAIEVKAGDVAGRAWVLGGPKDADEARKEKVQRQLRRLFGRQSFGDGLKCVWQDYEGLGNGYLELIPSKKGDQVAGLAHLPAGQMYVRLDGMGFVQRLGARTAHFRNAWVEPEKFTALDAGDPLLEATNQVMHFPRYSALSPWYGVPQVLPAFSAIALAELVGEYNQSFFSNNAIPDYAVLLEGDWDEDVEELIEQFFREHLKGNSHKTLVMTQPTGGKVVFQKLTSDEAREGGFRELRKDMRDEILQAHGVPPIRVGVVETGALGGNVGSEQLKTYVESIVLPGRETLETALTAVLERMGHEGLWFEFEPFDIDDELVNARVDAIYHKIGAKTAAEVREDRFPHLDPLEGVQGSGDQGPGKEGEEGGGGEVGKLEKSVAVLQKAVEALL